MNEPNRERKVCKTCNIENYLENYHKDGNWYKGSCKKCISLYKKSYRLLNIEKSKEKDKKYYKRNKDDIIKKVIQTAKENKEKYNAQRRLNYIKKMDEPLYRLKKIVRSRIRNIFKTKNIKKQSKSFELLGCDLPTLKKHLENLFKEKMSWDNQGFYGWHIDHIIPLSLGNTEEEIIKLCHYTNLQPLWSTENIKKSNKI